MTRELEHRRLRTLVLRSNPLDDRRLAGAPGVLNLHFLFHGAETLVLERVLERQQHRRLL